MIHVVTCTVTYEIQKQIIQQNPYVKQHFTFRLRRERSAVGIQ